MMVSILHSDRLLRIESDGDTEKDAKNLLFSRRLLMMLLA